MTYLFLFWEFFKVGLFTFGGGLASLPLLYDIAERYDWFTMTQLADMVAVAESTPGPIAVNMATFAGYQAAGIPGGIVATTALCLPELLMGFLVCRILARFASSAAVQSVFGGLRPAVAGLLTAVALSMVSLALLGTTELVWTGDFSWGALILLGFMLAGVFRLQVHPIVFIAVGAAAGIIFRF